MLREPFADWWVRNRMLSPWRATDWESAYMVWYLDRGYPARDYMRAQLSMEDELWQRGIITERLPELIRVPQRVSEWTKEERAWFTRDTRKAA